MHRILLGMALLGCVILFSCKEKKTPPPPPTPVNLYTVKAQPVLYYDKYPSTTSALSQVNLVPQVQGYITGIFFKEGDYVKKGQKLYEIDKRLYQAAVSEAEANVKVAEGNQEQAKQDADRYVYLNKYHAVATQLYDHAVTTYENSKSQVKAAEETVKTAKTNLAFSTIYAPFDGTIGFSQVKLGNMVSVGSTTLNTISTNDPMAVDFLINEKQLMDFENIQKAKQKPIDSLFTMLLPNGSLYKYTGTISIIDRAVDPQTGSIKVRLVFPNPENDLKVGMSCIVRVHNQDAAPQLVIPGRAVVEQMGEYFVFVVKDTVMAAKSDSAGNDGAKKSETKKTEEPDTAAQHGPRLYAFQKKVLIGQTVGANVVIKGGIRAGERIVVDGVQLLHDGSPVSAGKPGNRNGNDSTHAGRENDSMHNRNTEDNPRTSPGEVRKVDSSKNK